MSESSLHVFKRMVLALPPDGPSDEAMRAATEIARLLKTELHGVFLEEADVFEAASLGFATEFVAGAGPRRIEASRLEDDYRRAARRMERRLLKAAGVARLACRFDRVRLASGQGLAVSIDIGDLVAVFEPSRPEDRASGRYLGLRRTVSAGKGAALLMPRRVSAPGGAVAVVISDHRDLGSVDIAARIARTAGAPLEVWLAGAEPAKPDDFGAVADVLAQVRQHEALDDDDLARRLAGGTRLLIVGAGMTDAEAVEALLRAARRYTTPALVLARRPEADSG